MPGSAAADPSRLPNLAHMTRYQVDSEAVAAATGTVRAAMGRIQAEVAQLHGQLVGLQGSWTGQASAGFQTVVTRLARDAAARRGEPRGDRRRARPRRAAVRRRRAGERGAVPALGGFGVGAAPVPDGDGEEGRRHDHAQRDVAPEERVGALADRQDLEQSVSAGAARRSSIAISRMRGGGRRRQAAPNDSTATPPSTPASRYGSRLCSRVRSMPMADGISPGA